MAVEQPAAPLQERVDPEIFTDRETELNFLMNWLSGVAAKWEKSLALVSPRRYGKTAILERFYNHIYRERDDVIPFYYELKEQNRWLNEFIMDYFLSFTRQALAFRLKTPALAFREKVEPGALYRLAEEAGEEMLLRSIDYFSSEKNWRYPGLALDTAQSLPHRYASRTGLSIVVMFDEFQRLDEVLYYDEELTRKCHPLTGSFSSAVESRFAPMLIAGSQVTLLTRRALGGAMAGRVGTVYLDLMPPEAGAELALKWARRRGISLPLELAFTISRLTLGHPYYIWCLFNSRIPDRDLSSEEGVRRVLAFEVENPQGHINEFWRDHFHRNMAAVNEVNAKKIVLFLARNPDRAFNAREIITSLGLNLSPEEAEERLQKLMWGDIVKPAPSYGYYYGLKDGLLAQVLLALYGAQVSEMSMEESLAQVETEITAQVIAAQREMIAHLRAQLRNWVGRVAETFIEQAMKRCFEDQTVDGRYFHRDTPITLPRFARIHTAYAAPQGATRLYQIDLYGEPTDPSAPHWLVEVKNWARPVGQPEVDHFLRAAEHLRAERDLSNTVHWFYARSGFTRPAEETLQATNTLYSSEDDLLHLLRDLQLLDRWEE